MYTVIPDSVHAERERERERRVGRGVQTDAETEIWKKRNEGKKCRKDRLSGFTSN